MQILTAVLMFVYVVAALAVLYRVSVVWFARETNPQQLLADAFNALLLFAALEIVRAVGAAYVAMAVAPGTQIPAAVLAFVYVAVALAVLYRVVEAWFGGAMDPPAQLANAFGALAMFAALFILHTVAASYGLVPALALVK